VCPPKFWTGIIKLGLVLTIVQNFKLVGPRISEISRGKKKTSALKHKGGLKIHKRLQTKQLNLKIRYNGFGG